MLEEISNEAIRIRKLANELEDLLRPYGVHTRVDALSHIKELRKLLVDVTRLIEQREEQIGRSMVQTSDTQPCLLCNDHYPVASEYTRGLRWEPVPGKGWVYICWECAIALEKVIHRQISGSAYSFLFSFNKETQALRDTVLSKEKSTIAGVIDVEE